jgi:hypothetical protein
MRVRGTLGLRRGIVGSLAALACLAGVATARAAVLDPGPPSIESLSVSQLSSHRATLVAQIDPDQLGTTFEFWIEYANCQNVPPGHGECESISVRKVGEGTISAGPKGQYVSATATHLQGEYMYGYWVVATNSAGERKSAEQTFKALPEPTVEAESVTGQAPNPVELHATTDPHGQAVYYQFQLVSNASEYASELECPVFEVGPPRLPACTGQYAKGALPIGRLEASCGPHSVSLNLDEAGVGLKVGATYHYRLLVAPAVQTEDTIQWEGPPSVGADQSFTVGEDNVMPQNEQPVSGTGDDGSGPAGGGGPSVTGGSNQLSAPAQLRTSAFSPPVAHTRRHQPSPCSSAGSARSRRLHRRSLRRAGPARCARRTPRHRRR